MTTIIAIIAGLLLGPWVLFFLGVLIAPKSTFGFLDARLKRAMNVAEFNKNGRYSHPSYRPIDAEISGAPLTVKGRIPEDLVGAYVRNGTNSQFTDSKFPHHAFNGAGMLHHVQFKNGEARYSNTFIRTPRFLAEETAGEELYPEFGALVGTGKPGMFSLILSLLKQRFKVAPKLTALEDGSSTTAVLYHHKRFYALQETTKPFAMNAEAREGWLSMDGTGEWERFDGALDRPYTAHPKTDPKTGEVHAFSTHLASGDVHYDVVREGKLVRHEKLLTAKPSIAFVHDYFLTENFALFPDVSLRFAPKELMSDHKSVFYFDPSKPMRFGLVSRKVEGEVVWFETKAPGHIWHTINGWEETREDGGTDVVLYTPVFPDYPSTVPIHTADEPHANLMMYRLNVDSGVITEERELLAEFFERPTINARYLGARQRFAYLLDEGRGGIMGKGVLKYDLLEEKKAGYFDYGDAFGGEALFVPKDGAQHEDDGYLIELLMDETSAELLILNASTMSEIARLPLPQRVPFGVHATWLTEDQISSL